MFKMFKNTWDNLFRLHITQSVLNPVLSVCNPGKKQIRKKLRGIKKKSTG